MAETTFVEDLREMSTKELAELITTAAGVLMAKHKSAFTLEGETDNGATVVVKVSAHRTALGDD